MLVLSRQRDEKLKLTNVFYRDADGQFVPFEGFVTVVDIRGGKVNVGIDAPKMVGIDRCDAAGNVQMLKDASGNYLRALTPPCDNRPACPGCDSRMTRPLDASINLTCLNCGLSFPCPHTQKKTQKPQGGMPTEVCVDCRKLLPAGVR